MLLILCCHYVLVSVTETQAVFISMQYKIVLDQGSSISHISLTGMASMLCMSAAPGNFLSTEAH